MARKSSYVYCADCGSEINGNNYTHVDGKGAVHFDKSHCIEALRAKIYDHYDDFIDLLKRVRKLEEKANEGA